MSVWIDKRGLYFAISVAACNYSAMHPTILLVEQVAENPANLGDTR